MIFKGNIEVIANNNGTKTTTLFENEQFDISRGHDLAIILIDDINSEFYETLKIWNEIDQNRNTKTYLTIKTSPTSAFGSYTEYYIKKIVDDSKMIIFDWVGNY